MTATTSEDHGPPVLVLGCHRSGTSAVMGMLVEAAGLEVGDVLPPTSANAKGYYESTAIVRGHNQLLAAMDRDWTCPPPGFDTEAVPWSSIQDEVEVLERSGRSWGLKDPRTLFTLPVWAALLDEVRFVGVVRDHEEVVRSMVARDRLEPGVADDIARAYVGRLRWLCDRFAVPVVDFSAGPGEVVNRTRDLASALGLPWNDDAASSFFDDTLARSRGRGMVDDEHVDHLRRDATSRVTVPVVSRDELSSAIAELATGPDRLDLHSGPRAAARRRHVWGAVPRHMLPGLELARSLRLAASLDPVPSGSTAVEAADMWSLHEGLRTEPLALPSLTLPDVTSWVPRAQLEPLLQMVHAHTQPDGIVVVGRSTADTETRRRRGLGELDGEAIAEAATASGFAVLSHDDDGRLERIRLLALPTVTTTLRTMSDDRVAAAIAERSARLRGITASDGTQVVPLERYTDLERRYERLAGRRLVRLALQMAEHAQPLFRIVRAIRRRLRG